jgi:hypothetical protein
MAEDLEQSEKTDEKKAAEGFRAILAAFPETKKAPSDNTQGLNSWRKRSNSTRVQSVDHLILHAQLCIGVGCES